MKPIAIAAALPRPATWRLAGITAERFDFVALALVMRRVVAGSIDQFIVNIFLAIVLGIVTVGSGDALHVLHVAPIDRGFPAYVVVELLSAVFFVGQLMLPHQATLGMLAMQLKLEGGQPGGRLRFDQAFVFFFVLELFMAGFNHSVQLFHLATYLEPETKLSLQNFYCFKWLAFYLIMPPLLLTAGRKSLANIASGTQVTSTMKDRPGKP